MDKVWWYKTIESGMREEVAVRTVERKVLKLSFPFFFISVKAKNRKYCAGRKWSNILSRTQKFVLKFSFVGRKWKFQDIMVDCKCKIFFIKFSNLVGFCVFGGWTKRIETKIVSSRTRGKMKRFNELRVIRIDIIKHRSWTLDLSQPVVKCI